MVLAACGIAAARPPELNNARLAMLANHEDAVPAFEALFPRRRRMTWSTSTPPQPNFATLPPAQRRRDWAAGAGRNLTWPPDQAR